MEKNTIIYARASGIYNDSRAGKEISALREQGYSIIVLAWDKDGRAASACKDLFPDISFRFYTAPVEGGLGIKGIGKLLGFWRFLKKELKRMEPTSLLAVHACDLDAGLPLRGLCAKYDIPLIYDIYDYYADSHSLPSAALRYLEKQEIRCINQAHTTIICTEERRQQISLAKPQRITVLYNSPEVAELPHVPVIYDYAYCGYLGDGRMVKEILEAYPDNSDLKFFFAGIGPYAQLAQELNAKYENFTFSGSIPYQKVLETEAQSCILSAIYEPSSRNHRLCAPNKFYESLALDKPVIVCKGTGIDRIVEEEQIGRAIDYDVNAFYTALRELIGKRDNTHTARKLYESRYRWRDMATRLCEIYRTL